MILKFITPALLAISLFISGCGSSSDDPTYYGSYRIVNALEDGTRITIKILSTCTTLSANATGSRQIAEGKQRLIEIFEWVDDQECADYTNPIQSQLLDVERGNTYHFAIAGTKDDSDLLPLTLAVDNDRDETIIVNIMNLLKSKPQLNFYIVKEGETIDFSMPDAQLNYGTGHDGFTLDVSTFSIVLTETGDETNTVIFDSGPLDGYESSGLSWLILPYEGYSNSEYDLTAALYTSAGISFWSEQSLFRFISLYHDAEGYPDINIYVRKTADQEECPLIDPDDTNSDERYATCACDYNSDEDYCTLDPELDLPFMQNIPYGEVTEYSEGDSHFLTFKFTKVTTVDGKQTEEVFYERATSTQDGLIYTFTLASAVYDDPDNDEQLIYVPTSSFPADQQGKHDGNGTLTITNAFFSSAMVSMELLKEGETEATDDHTVDSLNFMSIVSPTLENGNYRIEFTDINSSEDPTQDEINDSFYDVTVNGDNKKIILANSIEEPGESTWIVLDDE